jgi:L-lactate dehydrogenase
MKVGIVGVGSVGRACALALVGRGCAREIVLVDRTRTRAEAVATDIRYGLPLLARAEITAGDYDSLAGSALVMITAGVNEKSGGATDRNDPQGRLRLLSRNADIYRNLVPRVVRAAPEAVILVVTDPPDPLADIARACVKHERVVSSGTFLDSLRFRVQLAQHFKVSPAEVEAQVVGDHGTAQVFLWSGARIASWSRPAVVISPISAPTSNRRSATRTSPSSKAMTRANMALASYQRGSRRSSSATSGRPSRSGASIGTLGLRFRFPAWSDGTA